jgi:hypothetical protein
MGFFATLLPAAFFAGFFIANVSGYPWVAAGQGKAVAGSVKAWSMIGSD